MSKDEKEICLYCNWWNTEGRQVPTVISDYTIGKRLVGQCRLESPAIGWPETFQHDWCGKFKDRRDDHESDNWQSIGDVANAVIDRLGHESD